ncbi:MAG: GTP-binding protein [Promethearchaeota archaeon]|nr:MAG: GTP-binding protein [Candidatus Lokiarchaeota archaeon]
MLQNIFLLKGKNFQDLENLNIYTYPEEILSIDQKDLISKIIYGHDIGDIVQNYRNGKKPSSAESLNGGNSQFYHIDSPVPQVIDDLNMSTCCINGKTIIGLVFEGDTNPLDYNTIFQELLNELLNGEKICSFEDETAIENLLITLFIDIRRYADEFIENVPEVGFTYQDSFIKVFLFGLDEAGKTSLVRRLKSGKYNDNYFLPTRKFNIEYIKEDKGALAIWDMPGQKPFRKKWLNGAQASNVLVYMIDVANQLRFKESKRELWKILNRYELSDIPVLILGNKIDLINHTRPKKDEHITRLEDELNSYFDFHQINNRDWKFLFTSVKTEYNIESLTESIFNLITI